MAVSQNGWSANDRSKVSSRLIPGTSVRLTVRNGPPGDLLLEVASLFDRLVQDIDNARGGLDDWGYAERPIRGSATTSNHASGTAIDLNATRWALGKPASVNLNPAQIAMVGRILVAANGCVRWGANYSGRKDPMHFELVTTSEAQCRAALANLRERFGTGAGAGPAPVKPAPIPTPQPREDEPMAIIPICPDDEGRFHEAAMIEVGSDFGGRGAITLGSTWGTSEVTVTALDHQQTVLKQWPSVRLANNGFWAQELPRGTRIVTVAGSVQDGGTRLAAALHTKAPA